MLPINPAVADPLRALLLSNPSLAFSSAQPDLSAQPFSPEQGPAPGSGLAALAAMTQQSPPMPQLAPGPVALPSQAQMQPPEANIPEVPVDETLNLGDATDQAQTADPALGDVVGGGASGFDPAALRTLAGYSPMPAPPIPPETPTDADLYPSRKAALWEAAIPAMGAIVAALVGGGKAGATGALLGGQQGFAQVNADKRERGLTDYSLKQQHYSRQVALYNQQWQQAKQRSDMFTQLSDSLAKIKDPAAAKAHALALRPRYAQFNIDPVEALPTPDEQIDKLQTEAGDVWTKAYAIRQKENPDLTVEQFNTRFGLTFHGQQMTYGTLGAWAGQSHLLPGMPSGIQSTDTTAKGLLQTNVAKFVEDHKREPNNGEFLQMKVDALTQYQALTHPDAKITRELLETRLQLAKQQLAKKTAMGGVPADVPLTPAQQKFAGTQRVAYETASRPFNQWAQQFDALKEARRADTAQGDRDMLTAYGALLPPDAPQLKNVQALQGQLAANPTQRLTEQQRTEMANRAQTMYTVRAKGQQQLFDSARKTLADQGIPPASVLHPQGSVDDTSAYRTLSPGDENDAEVRAFKGMNEGQRKVIQMIAQYKYPIGTRPSKDTEVLIGRAAIINPNLDLSQYAVRQKTRIAFTSGLVANQIRSVNTAFHHLAELKAAADQLTNGNWRTGNILKNAYGEEFGTARGRAVNVFNEKATAVRDELATAFKGAAGTDPQIEAWRETINPNMSKEMINDSIYAAIRLLAGRAESIRGQYNDAMGEAGKWTLLTPDTRKILTSFGMDARKIDHEDNPAYENIVDDLNTPAPRSRPAAAVAPVAPTAAPATPAQRRAGGAVMADPRKVQAPAPAGTAAPEVVYKNNKPYQVVKRYPDGTMDLKPLPTAGF